MGNTLIPIIYKAADGGGEATTWSRPTEWLSQPDYSSTDNEMDLLFFVGENYPNDVAFSVTTDTGDYQVDWGDGVVDTVSSGSVAEHKYTYTDIDTGTELASGQRQVMIKVTATNNFTGVNFDIKPSTDPKSYWTSDIIEINMIGSQISSLNLKNSNTTKLLNFNFQGTNQLTSTNGLFRDLTDFRNLQSLDTSSVTDMDSMFYECYALEAIPQLDTSSVTNMGTMFYRCYSLTTIPQLDTSSVTDMEAMFRSCRSLTTIPQLDTSSVTSMSSTFRYCYSLTTIPQLDTSSVTDMGFMFQYCYSLTTISQLDTSSVTDMGFMFQYCYSLTTIPQLDTSSVTDMGYMFGYGYSLSEVNFINFGLGVSSFDLENTNLTRGGLVNVFYDLPDRSAETEGTLTITGTYGTGDLTAADIQIATDKNWSIVT